MLKFYPIRTISTEINQRLYARVRKLSRELRSCREIVPTSRLLEHLVMGLDAKYDTLKSNLNIPTYLTEADYTAAMFIEEGRLNTYSSQPLRDT